MRCNYPTDHPSPAATSTTKKGAGLGSDGGTGGQPDRESDTQENAAEIHRRSTQEAHPIEANPLEIDQDCNIEFLKQCCVLSGEMWRVRILPLLVI